MNGSASWQENNSRQLASALANLRQRLEQFARQNSASRPIHAAPPNTVQRSLIQRLLRQPSAQPGQQAPAAAARLPDSPAPHGQDNPSARETTSQPSPQQGGKSVETPSALDLLSTRLNLSSFERNVLLLCAAMELDTRIASLCARAQDDPSKPFPTFALALALFEDPAWDALAPERPLRHWRLIDIHEAGAQPLTASALRADERIVSYLKGLNYLDDRLSPFFSQLELVSEPATLSESQARLMEMIRWRWEQASDSQPLPVAQLTGTDPISKQLIAYHTATQLNRRLYRLNTELLPAAAADLETLARIWQRESRLLPLALYLDTEESDGLGVERIGLLSRFLSRSDGVFFLGVREVMPRPGRAYFPVDISKPTAEEQRAAWVKHLGSDAGNSPDQLAAQFNLNLPSIEILAELAQAEARHRNKPLPEAAWDVCCTSERPRLDALAQRIEPKVTWDDLVLAKAELDLLRQIAAQVEQRNRVYQDWGFAKKMNRGFGISALFAGDSGTGKTMAAEVIANELRLNLYRIDLSQVVNKYIGETEKNLRSLFDAAEEGGAILFFDEADALFGKRSEVKDSHDRYANIEVNYLLQRMESYRGLAILATNMKSALDAAFLRRLRFIVEFPFPGAAERRRIWSQVFLQPESAKKLPAPPRGDLDYGRLARLNLTGGSIQNIALNACFRAAHMGNKITMPLILESARGEFRKLGRPINEAEFRWIEPAAVTAEHSTETEEPVLV